MAPLDPSGTARYKYTYQNAVNTHNIVFRVVTGTTVAQIDDIMQSLLSNLGIVCAASTVTNLEFAALGSNIFNPVSGSTVVGDTFGSGTATKKIDATFIGFVGRGDDGRRARLFLFGFSDTGNDFRILGGESTGVDDFLNTINDPDAPLLTISGSAPIWKNYANLKTNDHWVDKGR